MQGQDYAQDEVLASDDVYALDASDIEGRYAWSSFHGHHMEVLREEFKDWHQRDRAEASAAALRSVRDLLAMSYSIGALTHPMDMLRFLDERARSIEAQGTPAEVSS